MPAKNILIVLVILGAIVVLYYFLNKKGVISNEGALPSETAKPVSTSELVEQVVKEKVTTPNLANINTLQSGNWQDMFSSDLRSATSKEVRPVVDNSSLANTSADTVILDNANPQEIDRIVEEKAQQQLDFKNADLLPQEINKEWFETDFSNARIKIGNDNMVNTERYVIGVNTVGQSLKNASWDLRPTPACPKITVSPWNQSTIEPDYNIKPWF